MSERGQYLKYLLGTARFAVSRLLQSLGLLLGVVMVMFLLIRMAPGDPVQAMVGDFPVPDEYRDQVARQYRLNDSWLVQFMVYLGHVARGDLGYSYASHQSVGGLILERLPATLLLTAAGLISAAAMGIALGTWSAVSSRRSTRAVLDMFVLVGFSIPTFWLGQMLVLLFALRLGWLPSGGMSDARAESTGWASLLAAGPYLVLPAVALGIRELAATARIAKGATMGVLSEDYIVTARSKGLSSAATIRRHVIRNAALPTIASLGYRVGLALAGAVTIEVVFSWPGIGRLLYQAILARDNSLVVGVILVIAVLVIIANLVTELLYRALDPRIRGARHVR
ncbi:transporter [Streptosporangium violaceochromogenes]|nr:transporter [Streptosporangium violaceochromogenes]